MSLIVLGAIATTIAIWCIARKKAAKFSVWAAAVGGLTLGFGLLARAATRIATVLEHAGSKGSALLFGAAVPAVLAVVVLAELVHAGHPKKGKPHRWIHPALAFVAPALLIAAGGVFAEVVGWAHHGAEVLPTSFNGSGR